jgi:hypothetical protein
VVSERRWRALFALWVSSWNSHLSFEDDNNEDELNPTTSGVMAQAAPATLLEAAWKMSLISIG